MSNQEVRPTILLVDEDRIMRNLLQIDLQEAGYRVLTAGDGCEAVSLVPQCPDLLITGLVMPGMDGLELIRHWRRTYPATKIIALFKTSGIHYLKVAQWLGADAALQKPIPPATLLEIVEQQISRNGSRQ